MIPFLDVGATYRELQPELDAAYRRVMDRGWFILGQEVTAFEEEFAAYCEVEHCIGVGNGLDALSLVLRAMDIGPGDEVIVPGNTFIATWLAVTQVGATPVAVDPDAATYNLDPDLLQSALSSRTRAVIPVHLYGQPAEMKPLLAFAEAHGLAVVEDAAQAHGATCNSRRVGGLGHAACFSFYPGKNLGCFGDGGAITTCDAELADRLRQLRNYGSPRKYQHDLLGVNSRLDDLQAAFLRVKLARLDDWNDRRRDLAKCYCERLAGVPGVAIPRVATGSEPVWHLLVIRHPRRDALRLHLRNCGIEAMVHYPTPPHRCGAYAQGGWKGAELPVTDQLAREVLSLPMGPHLSEEAVNAVCDAVTALDSRARRAA